MKTEGTFDRKAVEQILFATYKNEINIPRRKTRTYLRKMARHIEHGYEIGFRDAAASVPLVRREEIPAANSSLEQDMLNLAYTAYRKGYEAGVKGGAGK